MNAAASRADSVFACCDVEEDGVGEEHQLNPDASDALARWLGIRCYCGIWSGLYYSSSIKVSGGLGGEA